MVGQLWYRKRNASHNPHGTGVSSQEDSDMLTEVKYKCCNSIQMGRWADWAPSLFSAARKQFRQLCLNEFFFLSMK